MLADAQGCHICLIAGGVWLHLPPSLNGKKSHVHCAHVCASKSNVKGCGNMHEIVLIKIK